MPETSRMRNAQASLPPEASDTLQPPLGGPPADLCGDDERQRDGDDEACDGHGLRAKAGLRAFE